MNGLQNGASLVRGLWLLQRAVQMQAVAALLQYSINKLQVLNRGRIIGPAEIVIQLAVVGV
ncbi:MAG: hypothetical protein ACK58H_12135, partial [Planctomyces sp.]